MTLRTTFLAALLGLAAPAFAQSEAPAAFEAPAAPDAAKVESLQLRRLPADASGLEFDGERASRLVWVYLAEAEAKSGGELLLALQSGVSVMPEASSLSVLVNGQQAGLLKLGGVEANPTSVTLPPSILRPGWNVLALVASQRHRVDCRAQATYDLWTRIAPERSGLRFADAAEPKNLTDMPTLGRAADGTLPIRIRLEGQSDGELAAGFSLAAAAARAAGGPVRVDAARAPLVGGGLEVLAGTHSRLLQMGVPPALAAAAGREGPQWLVGGEGGRLVVSAGAGIDLGDTLRRFEAAVAAPPGISAPLDDAGADFATLGIPTEEFSGRLFRRELSLRLPDGSLIADYGRVTLLLEAAYAAGLGRDAGLSVFVNDRLAATLPFGQTGGEEFHKRQIDLPLSAFRPGENRVAIEARLPDPSDATCRAQNQIDGRPRFLLLGDSRLVVPPLARMARLPDLAATVAAGSALSGRDPTMRIFVAASDADTVSAAATFFVRNALAAGRVPPLELGAPDPSERRSAIVVGAVRDVGESLLAEGGLDASALLAAVDGRVGGNGMASVLDTMTTGSILMPSRAPGPAESRSALQNWHMRTRGDERGRSGGLDWLDAAGADVRRALGFGGPPEIPPSETIRLAVTQAMGPDREGPLTLVTALTPEDLAGGVRQLAATDGWSRLAGQGLIVDDANRFTAIPARAVRFVSVEDGWSPANMRLVTAAWFSLNPFGYALIVFALAVLFGLLSYALVRRSGVRACG